MLDKYFNYFHFLMRFAYYLKIRAKKKGMLIYRFEKIILVCINDFDNRRVIIFFYHKEKKILHRTFFHGYYVRQLRLRLVKLVEKIQTDENFFEQEFIKRRSYSYKQDRSYKRYTYFKSKKQ